MAKITTQGQTVHSPQTDSKYLITKGNDLLDPHNEDTMNVLNEIKNRGIPMRMNDVLVYYEGLEEEKNHE